MCHLHKKMQNLKMITKVSSIYCREKSSNANMEPWGSPLVTGRKKRKTQKSGYTVFQLTSNLKTNLQYSQTSQCCVVCLGGMINCVKSLQEIKAQHNILYTLKKQDAIQSNWEYHSFQLKYVSYTIRAAFSLVVKSP